MGSAKYEILGTLGSGATGTVYLADEFDLDRKVAYKELAPALATDPVFLERFRGEARVMAALDHPNCVKVWDFFEEEGHAVLVSEYVPGASLRQVADHSGHLTPEQALGVLKGALTGLAYAHGRGLVHRDIKPENLLADTEGVSKLADFGQALIAGGPGAAGGLPAGSPTYMSPEMVSGGRVDLRTDIYSCGAMLFEFLTGRPAFTGDNPLAVMRKHINDPVPDPRQLNSDLPEGVAALVSKAMAKDPAERQRTAEQFLDELEAAAVAGYGADWEQRSSIKRLVAAAAAALGLLLVGGGAALASTGMVGEAVVGGVSKLLIAAGVAGVAILLFAVFGFASGIFGGSHNTGGKVAVAASPSPFISPSPSPTDGPSPTPVPTPSPSPSPSTSPSPTATVSAQSAPSPTPRATQPASPSAPTPSSHVSVTAPVIYWSYCSVGTCTKVAPGSSPTPVTCDSSSYFAFGEQYRYNYPAGPGGSVPIYVNWNASYPAPGGGRASKSGSPVSQTVTPGSSGGHPVGGSPTFTVTPDYVTGQVDISMSLSWVNSDGSAGNSAASPISLVCSAGKP